MSLILDALRKMEQERKARKQASTGMRQEVLNYRGSASKADKSLLIPVVAGALLTVAAVGIYLYRAGEQSAPPPPVVAPPASLPAQPVPQPAQLPAPNATPLLLPGQQTTAVEMPPVKLQRKTGPVMKQSEPVQSSGDSSLVVSGIAWQDERNLRRAVVNGQLVGEGGEIQGAKIVEIRENRVRFTRNGTVIDVSYP
jgi:general secretion pathway protein B